MPAIIILYGGNEAGESKQKSKVYATSRFFKDFLEAMTEGDSKSEMHGD